MRLTLFATIAMTLMGCPEPDPCGDWVGTWRGNFAGSVEGRAFDLSGMDFQLQLVANREQPLVSIPETNWQLAPGYSASLVGWNLECDAPQLSLKGTFCKLRGPSGTDNCDFTGAFFREGDSSGSFKAPQLLDGSPTYTANGTWTLSR